MAPNLFFLDSLHKKKICLLGATWHVSDVYELLAVATKETFSIKTAHMISF